MIMIRAIIRPEKTDDVLAALMDAGFPAVTKMDVYGRGNRLVLKWWSYRRVRQAVGWAE